MSSNRRKCEICLNIATEKCSGCHRVYYCSRDHQKGHWKYHKNACYPYKICSDVNSHRFTVASRDIQAGETIVQEAPLISGPSQNTIPVCLGCLTAIDENQFRPCSKCGWPVCSEICEKSPNHIPECQYTVSSGSKVTVSSFGTVQSVYQCVMVLRCLYQKQFLSDVWKKLNGLQSRCVERQKSSKYEKDRTSIVQFLLRDFKLKNVFDEDEVLRVCGLIAVNGLEVTSTTPPHVAIYKVTSNFVHNCSANCTKTFTKEGSIVVRAGCHIKKGEQLSLCYVDPFCGTAIRRSRLYENKFIQCDCSRCSDPTEFQTFFSALRCQSMNCSGYLLPHSFLEETHNGKLPNWMCNKCNATRSSYHVQEILDRVDQDKRELDTSDVEAVKAFVKSYEQYLHSNHYYLADVKLAMIKLFRSASVNHSEEALEFRTKLCQSLSGLVSTLAPGEAQLRAYLHYELHVNIIELAKRNSNSDLLPLVVQKSRPIIKEAVEYLRPFDERFCEEAQKSLNKIDEFLINNI